MPGWPPGSPATAGPGCGVLHGRFCHPTDATRDACRAQMHVDGATHTMSAWKWGAAAGAAPAAGLRHGGRDRAGHGCRRDPADAAAHGQPGPEHPCRDHRHPAGRATGSWDRAHCGGPELLPYARAGLDTAATGVAMLAQDQVVGQARCRSPSRPCWGRRSSRPSSGGSAEALSRRAVRADPGVTAALPRRARARLHRPWRWSPPRRPSADTEVIELYPGADGPGGAARSSTDRSDAGHGPGDRKRRT